MESYRFCAGLLAVLDALRRSPDQTVAAREAVVRVDMNREAVNEVGVDRLHLLESVVQNANDAILVTEAEPFDEPGPRVIYVNEAFTRMTGYTPEDVIGKTPRILQGPNSDRESLDKIRHALSRWRPILVELLNYRKDGTEFWVELNIVPVADETGWYTHWVSVQRETTERRLVEERVRESLARNASDLAAIVGIDGTVRYVTPPVERILGYRPEALVGRDIFDYVHEDDRRWVRESFESDLTRSGVGRPMQFRSRHRDGSWRYLEAVGHNLLEDPGVRGVVINAWDITKRRRVEEELRLRDRAISASSNGIIITDATVPENPIIYVNPGFEEITGYTAREVTGLNCRFLAGEDRDQASLVELRDAIGNGREGYAVLRNYRKDGTVFYNELSISPVHDKDGRLTNFVGVQKDITERRRLEERLAHQAFHDPLTDLPNRARFMERLEHALERTRRQPESNKVAVLFMDLDNFKFVNDSLGHEVGDEMLIAVAERLKRCLRLSDTAARLGGDEFTILIEDLDCIGKVTSVARRISRELRAPLVLGESGQEVFVTTSIGISVSDSAADTPKDLLKAADLAMYKAKEGGKDRYEVFETSMDAQASRRLSLESDLRRALEREEFRVFYQPKVSTADGEILGVEALLRWQKPDGRLVSPGEFIPIAEETGLIVPIGRWVLREACRQARDWETLYPPDRPLTMSVNLSARQFHRPGLAEDVERVLQETGFDPANLVLEITESAAMVHAGETVELLKRLKDLGVRLAIDDFGTGYSSLSYLKRFPADFLKIDRSFVDGLGRDPEDLVLVSAMLNLAETMGLVAVAEGVETADQLAQLRELECVVAQGFYFSEPQAASKIPALLSGRSLPRPE